MLFWTFQFKVVGLPCLQEICRDIWGGMILFFRTSNYWWGQSEWWLGNAIVCTTTRGRHKSPIKNAGSGWWRTEVEKEKNWEWTPTGPMCPAEVSLTKTLNLSLLTQCRLPGIKVSAACLKCKCRGLKVKLCSAAAIHHLFIPLTFWSS